MEFVASTGSHVLCKLNKSLPFIQLTCRSYFIIYTGIPIFSNFQGKRKLVSRNRQFKISGVKHSETNPREMTFGSSYRDV